MSYQELATREVSQYLEDVNALNLRSPDAFPYASDEIPGMIDLVHRLLDAGHAYRVGGHVYFSVATDAHYGELSRCTRAEMIELARERGGDPDDPLRRDPLDFVLWRPALPGEPTYDSPWGRGLPGWHIECSTMVLTYLGETVDIHGGGADLIFPHHENEIAQSEAATGRRPFARFWMHAAMVYLGGEKMSKSLGNMVFVRDLVPRWGADGVRLYLAGCHYRSDLHYDAGALADAAAVATELADAATGYGGAEAADLDLAAFRTRFEGDMNSDLDTPGAIGVLRELAGAIRTARQRGSEVSSAQQLLHELGEVLGLRLEKAGKPARS
jgi:L-cysteine:1D-myo-inositol 2-amino-2-deoxy-alpha-D-glucopyranoside ligase